MSSALDTRHLESYSAPGHRPPAPAGGVALPGSQTGSEANTCRTLECGIDDPLMIRDGVGMVDRESSSEPAPGSRRWRKIRNEMLSRGVNEKIESLLAQDDAVSSDESLRFFCECAAADCRERVILPLERYSEIHARRDDFVVRPGHQAQDVERVVESEPGYLVVRKVDLPAD
jgi:hypothetical protein